MFYQHTSFSVSLLALALSACGASDGEASEGLLALDRTSSVSGVDNNSDGIRDDVESRILKLADSKAEEGALTQAAIASQASLVVDHADSNAVRIVANNIMRSVACMSHVYGSKDGRKMILRIESLTTNTPERLAAYSSFQKSASGRVYRLPSREGACD